MITAKFYGTENEPTGFRISGHSGYAEAGGDIVCAAVSANSMLVINTLTDFYGAQVRLDTDEESALIDFEVISCPDEYLSAAAELLKSFKNELKELGRNYPEYIKAE